MSLDVKKTRWIRKIDDGSYTMEPVSVLQRSSLICDSCGIRNACPIYENVKKVGDIADLHVRSCRKYVPLMVFRRPMIGLDDAFNTLRVGRTWYDRLKGGRGIVALVDSFNKQPFGFATVTDVYVGGFNEMIRTHALFNHLAHGEFEGSITDHVEHVLRKSYGQFLNEESQLTAIYLKRVEHEGSILKKAKEG